MVALSETNGARPLIAILLGAPLTAQNFRRTGIPELAAHFGVVVLDCNRWLRPGYAELQFSRHPYEPVVEITSATDFERAIARIKPAYAIDFIGVGEATSYIQDVLRRSGSQFVVQKTGSVPAPAANRQAYAALRLLFTNPLRLIRKLTARISGRRQSAIAPDVALVAGRRSLDAFTSKARTVLWIASQDYHVYRSIGRSSARHAESTTAASDYAVFIDDCLALATDYRLMRIAPPVAPGEYFAMLRQALDRFERLAGLRVVVAAHPNGREIDGYRSLFGDREVHFDATANLCAAAAVVLSHLSTGLSYAVLGRRPIVILTSRSLDRSDYGPAIRERSAQLKCPLLFMDSDDAMYRAALVRGRELDESAYEAYVENYIISGEVAEERPWQTFVEYVQRRAARGADSHDTSS